jgi:cytochrome c553
LIRAAIASQRGCAGCHGPAGVSRMPEVPSLAAQPAALPVLQMILFREGLRDVPAMAEAAGPCRGGGRPAARRAARGRPAACDARVYRDDRRVGADTQMNALRRGLAGSELADLAHHLAQAGRSSQPAARLSQLQHARGLFG